MRDEIKDLQSRFSLATIYVTHDQEEAMALSDRIIVMNGGRIEQVGHPLEVYDRPRTRFVADFIGAANILSGQLRRQDGRLVLQVGEAALECTCALEDGTLDEGERKVAVRTVYPELRRLDMPSVEGANIWPARIARRTLLGDTVWYDLEWPGGALRVHALPGDLFDEDEAVRLRIPPRRAVLLAD